MRLDLDNLFDKSIIDVELVEDQRGNPHISLIVGHSSGNGTEILLSVDELEWLLGECKK